MYSYRSVKGFTMAETSGSCGINSYRRNTGIYRPEVDVLKKLKRNYEIKKTEQMMREYERIMNIPPSERTFSEKMLIAQVEAEKVGNFINSIMEPNIKYLA